MTWHDLLYLSLIGSWACYGVGAIVAGISLARRPEDGTEESQRTLTWRSCLVTSLIFASIGSALGVAATIGAPEDGGLVWRVVAGSIKLDLLTRLFLGLFSIMGLFSTLCSIDYTRSGALERFYRKDHEELDEHRRRQATEKNQRPPVSPGGRASVVDLPLMGLVHNVLSLALSLAVTANNAFLFLIAWDAVFLSTALATYLKGPRNRAASGKSTEMRAALKTYLIFGQLSVLGLTVGMLLLGLLPLSQQSLTDVLSRMPQGPVMNIAQVSLCLGALTFAAVAPFHAWFPLLHGAIPACLRPLVSATALKLGVYGVLRLCLTLEVAPPYLLGVALVLLGGASTFLGLKYAMAVRDITRLFAYHTLQGMGIIFVGLGVAMVGRSLNEPKLALLGLSAALLSTVAHTVYQGLLLMTAARFEAEMGDPQLRSITGAWKRLPLTSMGFVIGALSLAAAPPLSGFGSEWLTFQALIYCMPKMGSQAKALSVVVPVLAALLLSVAAVGTALSAGRAVVLLFADGQDVVPKERARTWYATNVVIVLSAGVCSVLGLVAHRSYQEALSLAARILHQRDAAAIDLRPPRLFLLMSAFMVCTIAVARMSKLRTRTSASLPWNQGGAAQLEPARPAQLSGLSVELSTIPKPQQTKDVRASHREHDIISSAPTRVVRDEFRTFQRWLAEQLRRRACQGGLMIQSGRSGTYLAYLLVVVLITLLLERLG